MNNLLSRFGIMYFPDLESPSRNYSADDSTWSLTMCYQIILCLQKKYNKKMLDLFLYVWEYVKIRSAWWFDQVYRKNISLFVSNSKK